MVASDVKLAVAENFRDPEAKGSLRVSICVDTILILDLGS
jgi:hypothetical protein